MLRSNYLSDFIFREFEVGSRVAKAELLETFGEGPLYNLIDKEKIRKFKQERKGTWSEEYLEDLARKKNLPYNER